MKDRRRTPRLRSYVGGRINFGWNSAMDCLVRNLSPEGAKLVFTNTLAVGDIFDLFIPQQGRTRRVRMAWRQPEAMGVRFLIAEASANVVPIETARRIRSLEAENAELHHRLAEHAPADAS
jgi:hypothetical protein